MQRDAAYLRDILEAARLAVQYVSGRSQQDFLADVQCQDAVIRRIELIGEAAKRVSGETRQLYSQLPWNEMVAMRNFVIHQYDDIDLGIIWDTARQNLPGLILSLQVIVEAES